MTYKVESGLFRGELNEAQNPSTRGTIRDNIIRNSLQAEVEGDPIDLSGIDNITVQHVIYVWRCVACFRAAELFESFLMLHSV